MKRILTILSVALMVFALALGGCKKASAPAGASKGPVSITVEVFNRGTDGGKTDPANNNWTNWIKEKVLKDENIQVTFISISRWDENTALNNLMAAGNPPDLCLTYSGQLIDNYRDLGGLFEFSGSVDTVLKDYKEFLGPDMALPGRDFIRRYMDSSTGKIYSLPSRRMNTALRNLWIRKDWLDKLGLPLPTTPEEYFNALAAFRDRDPGNVGRGNVIPFTMSQDVRWTAGNIVDPFIDPNMDRRERWINVAVDRNFLLPGYKEGFRFLNRMFNAGLIDRDFALYKSDDDHFRLFKAGMVGSISHNWDHIYRDSVNALADLQKNVPGAEVVPIDPMKSSDGITHKGAYDAAGVRIFIPAGARDPDAAMRYLNWMSRYENYHFLQTGPEGIVHDVVDGIPKLKSVTGPWIQNSAQNIDYTPHINGLDLRDPALTARALANSYSFPAEVISEAYRVATLNAAPMPVIPATLSAAGPVQQTLVDKGLVIFAESVMCKPEEFDRVWDAGIKDWLASGAQTVVDERRAKYIAP